MEASTARELWGKYYDEINKLGNTPLNKSITIKDLKLSKTALSGCYRDMKSLKFERNVVEFLCYISTHNFMCDWRVEFEDTYGFESTKYAEAVKKDDYFYVQKIMLLKLLHLHFKEREHGINTIRLFNRDSYYIYNTDAYRIYNGTFDEKVYRKVEETGLFSVETFPSYFFFKTINGIRYLEETLLSFFDNIREDKDRDKIISVCVTSIAFDIVNTLRINPDRIENFKF